MTREQELHLILYNKSRDISESSDSRVSSERVTVVIVVTVVTEVTLVTVVTKNLLLYFFKQIYIKKKIKN